MIEPGAGLEAGVAVPSHAGSRILPSGRVLALGGVIAWSAFLLFLGEPMIGRLVLPSFGGTPAVWATTLCFFQVVLLLGYAYGHVSITRLGTRRGAIVHLALVAAAGVALALAPDSVADLRIAGVPDAANLLGILLALIGLPALVLTTTTPLLSAWAARAWGHETRGDAYWLYALSNAGSLAALLAYPFLVEPRLGLAAQRGIWAAGYALLAVTLVACAVWARTLPESERRTTAAGADLPAAEIPTRRRLRWLLYAAVPSGLLNAVTTYIATDLVSAPLIWLIPLAIYLASFILAFSERGRRVVPVAVALAPAAITLMWVPTGSAGAWPILPLVLLMYGGLAIVATALHGRLALDRPPAGHLTEFYLLVSIGGALAAIFVAIAAPILFPGVWELPILLVLALVALAVGHTSPDARSGEVAPSRSGPGLAAFVRGAPSRLGPFALGALALAAFLVAERAIGIEAGVRWLLVGGVILLFGGKPMFLAVSTACVLALALIVLQPAAVFRDRSFFGVTTVLRPAGTTFTVLLNGTTTHGVQSTDPALARVPEAYYARPGPFGDVFRTLAADGAGHAVAAVGLGAGAVATYLEPGWSMDIFEIDPLVADVASNPDYFTYLSGAAAPTRIVIGDARLSLLDVASGTYDALLVDAFSSDAIPAHLLTKEAMAEYLRVVRPGGIVLVHVSNRYYDLSPAVSAAAEANGVPALRRVYLPTPTERDAGAAITDAVVVTASEPTRARLIGAGWTVLPATVDPMTDDFLDLLRFLRPLW